MPYRIDIASPPPDALDVLVHLGALDVELLNNSLAAILPDSVNQDSVAAALGVSGIATSDAVARDNGSVWLLSPSTFRVGGQALRLTDSNAFGTGHHPTTALCIEVLEEILSFERVDSILDVGTGSGILALAALTMGVPQATGLDIDQDALKVAVENARLNHLADRMQLILGGPDVVAGQWPLVVANVLAAPLIKMAPVLVRRLGKGGRLILGGISWSLESEVRQAYKHCGIRHIVSKTRAGWTVLIAQSPW